MDASPWHNLFGLSGTGVKISPLFIVKTQKSLFQ